MYAVQLQESLTDHLLPSGAVCAGADTDKSQLKTADVNSLFPGDARIQPLPLPLGPAYNNTDFKAYLNVTVQMYTDQPAGSFAVNQSVLSNLVNGLGRLYYPQGVLFEVWLPKGFHLSSLSLEGGNAIQQ